MPIGTGRRPRLLHAIALALLCGALAPAYSAESSTTPTLSAPAPATSAAGPATEPDQSMRPLVIVLDTSGSMSEADDTGTIKLAGAQAALSQVIRQQRPGMQLGLWTYPGGGSGCDGGGFEIDVQDLDQQYMIETIRGLTANGDTPTAEALLASVEQLKAQGYSGATILLISDGHSTCDDPCAAAEQVVDQGFDLTVQAAGFQISDDGLDELQCIADATGGEIYEATDGSQLEQVIVDATRAELTMTIEGIPTRTPVGSASRVKVTVTNNSAIDIENARAAITFTNDVVKTRPVVWQCCLRSCTSATSRRARPGKHEWVVSYGGGGDAGGAQWRASAWGKNAQPKVQTGAIDVFAGTLDLSDGGPVIQDLAGKRIAILGDSYSAGEGSGDYLDSKCHRSKNTYLRPLFDSQDVIHTACTGATANGFLWKSDNTVRGEQVGKLGDEQRSDKGPAAAAFMTVGGNDIGFGLIVGYCVFGHPRQIGNPILMALTWDTRCSDDLAFRLAVEKGLHDIGASLTTTLREVYDELNAKSAVKKRRSVAPLYVLAYPQAFPEPQWVSQCSALDSQEIAFANSLVDDLNRRIETVINGLRRDRYRIQMITTTQEAFLPDNTSCPRPGAKPFMNPINAIKALGFLGSDLASNSQKLQELMHPNKDGYKAETNAIIQWSSAVPDESPPQGGSWRQGRDDSGFGLLPVVELLVDVLTPTLPAAGPARYDASAEKWVTPPVEGRAGQPLEISVENAAPGSPVLVSMASRQRVVATLGADESGRATATITMPNRAQGGHTLTAVAFDAEGNPSVGSQEITIKGRIPFWLFPLAALTLLSFGLWLLTARRYRRRERRQLAGPEPVSGMP